jgi:hypothetical protein
LRVGVPANVVEIIKHRKPTAGIDRQDGVPIDLVRQMWRDHKVTPQLFAEARKMFGTQQLIDLITLSGNYAGTAVLLQAVDMQLHAGKQPLLPIP